MSPDRLIQSTESLCPVCLKVLPADIIKRGDEVLMCRQCPEHGLFEEAIWRGQPDFEAWRRPKRPAAGVRTQLAADRGCPYDCGLCPEHGQHPCTILFEITRQCNLGCPICFANSGGGESGFTPLPQLLEQMRWFHGQTGGEVVLQLSGGEPTLHPDLPALVAEGAKLFPAVQLNTNGLKLAEDPALPRRLAEAGLSWVFLQFDGVSDRSFEIIRGRPLLEKKMAAISACAEVGLSVVLVPTVAAGVNDGELGDLVRLAVNLAPTVRGVHIQPMTSAGRNSLPRPQTGPYSDEGQSGHNWSSVNRLGRLAAFHRLTLPEVLQRLSEQTRGLIDIDHAFPPSCEHERCSFHLRYRRTESGELIPTTTATSNCCCKTGTEPSRPEETAEARSRSVDIILKSWQGEKPAAKPTTPLSGLGIPMAAPAAPPLDAFDEFLAKARRETFSITCMVFQDAWTVDLERLRGCCVHIFRPPDRFVPFCACNLTSADGHPLYR